MKKTPCPCELPQGQTPTQAPTKRAFRAPRDFRAAPSTSRVVAPETGAGAARAAVTGHPPPAPHDLRSISGRGATAKEALRRPPCGTTRSHRHNRSRRSDYSAYSGSSKTAQYRLGMRPLTASAKRFSTTAQFTFRQNACMYCGRPVAP